jgi:alpha-beta hydrolase superfamily lysophospholipase
VVTFRWAPYERTGELVQRFSAGLNRLARCAEPETSLLVLAHSAGGVIAALASGRLEEAAATTTVVTVASPLAGLDRASVRADGLSNKPFVVELGGRLSGYAAPRSAVRYLHLRTSPKTDPHMAPAASGHRPDDPRAVVPGAQDRLLPDHVGHDQALLWAARSLVGA